MIPQCLNMNMFYQPNSSHKIGHLGLEYLSSRGKVLTFNCHEHCTFIVLANVLSSYHITVLIINLFHSTFLMTQVFTFPFCWKDDVIKMAEISWHFLRWNSIYFLLDHLRTSVILPSWNIPTKKSQIAWFRVITGPLKVILLCYAITSINTL